MLLFSHPAMSDSLQLHGQQLSKPPCLSPSPRVCPRSCSSYQWCHSVISSSYALFSFCPQSFPASGTFPVSHPFSSDGQNTGASASELVLPLNIQGWSPLRLTGLISLLSKGLSGVFSSTTVQRHQFFSILPSLRPSSHNRIDQWEDHSLDYMDLCWRVMSLLFSTLSRFVIVFLLITNRLLISWLQSPSALILEPKKRKCVTTSTFSPSICHAGMGTEAMILIFLIFSLKPALSLPSFTLIKRFFSSSSGSDVRVVSSAYLRLLMFLPFVLIPVCNSSCLAFLMMCSA